ncbi:MAG: phage tail tube protein [Patescibacteria group bacterium]|nr:phage tail tube protein [Patescibacteria group bacterium]
MTVKLGREPFLGVGIESTAGTAVAASKYLPFVTCTIRGMQEPIADEAAKGVREKVWGAITGQKHGEGDVEIYADVENAALLLYPALGSISSGTASGEASVYEHTITRKASNPPKTVTLIYNDTQDTRKYPYSTINNLELNVADGLATISANFMSKFPSSGTGSQAITEERVLAFKDYTVKFGSGATGTAALTDADGASVTAISSFTLRINNNAEVQYLSGDNDAAQISMGQLEIDGEFVLFYESTADRVHYETLLDGSNAVRAMVISFTGDSIGSAETEEIQIRIPNFHLSERGVDTATAGFITENPTFVAQYDPTETKSIEIIITNQTASY